MTLHAHETWAWLTTSPLLGLTLTVAAYWLGRRLLVVTRGSSLAQPVLVAIVLVSAALLLLDISYENYMEGGRMIAFLLGPATVSLALPLHHEWARVRRSSVPVLGGVLVGTLVSVSSAVLLTRWLGGSELLQRTMAPKATTSPVAIALSEQLGAIPALTAVVTIIAGTTAAVVGPWVLTRVGVRHEEARGIAIGTTSHGIGTARALHESRTEGAFSGLAMALTALATSLVLPWLVPLLVG